MQKSSVEYRVINNDSIEVGYYDRSKKLKYLSLIKDGREHGVKKEYYEEGKIHKMGLMQNGRKSSLWLEFTTDSAVCRASHYYDDSLILELDIMDFRLKKVESPDGVFRMYVPTSWQEFQKKEDDQFLSIAKIQNKRDALAEMNGAKYDNILLKMKFRDFVDEYIGILKENMQNFRIVFSRNLLVDGSESYQFGASFLNKGRQMGAIVTQVGKGDHVYIVTGIAPSETSTDFFKYKGLFEYLITTIDIE